MTIGKIKLDALRTGVLLNASSGSCDEGSDEKLAAILRQAGIQPVALECVEGPKLDETLTKITELGVDMLIVLGGDGTIRAAAERCGSRNIILVPLPGGTMNMLPNALYGKVDWPAVLSSTLAAPRLLKVSGGEVEGHRFFCAGIFGAPSLWSRAREAVRSNRLLEALDKARDAYRRVFSRNLHYQFGTNARGTGTAVTVICPLVSSALPSDEQTFEAAAMDVESARAAFRLAVSAVFSDWRLDPSVVSCPVGHVSIHSRGPIPAILDGETVQLSRRAEVRFVPHSFNALVPIRRPTDAAS